MSPAPAAPGRSWREALATVTGRVAQLRWPLVLFLGAGLTGAGLALNPGTMSDLHLFTRFAQPLLSGHLGRVYADPGNQAGPLELAWVGAWSRLGAALGAPGAVAAGVATAMLVGALTLAAARHATAGADPGRRARVELAAGLLAAVSLTPWAAGWGHPAEVVIPLAWLAACRWGGQGRALAAALVLAGAAGVETWALLGVPLLLAAGWRRAVWAAPVAVAGAAAWYAPFAMSGPFAMSQARWPVTTGTLAHLLGLTEVPWTLRLAQAGLVAAGCAAAVALTRGRPDRAWLPVFVLAALRLGTDPLPWPYYWCLPLLPVLLGWVSATSRRDPRHVQVLLLVAVLALAAPHADPPWGYPALILAAAAVAVSLRWANPSSLLADRP